MPRYFIYFYIISGKLSSAKPFLIKLKEISPLDWLTHFAAGWIEFIEGNFASGLESLSKMYKLDPKNKTCVRKDASILDIAPTILDEMGLAVPEDMRGTIITKT